MRPSKRTQPYRGGTGPAGPAKRAMNRGRPANAPHPSAQKRLAAKRRKKKPRSLYRQLRAFGRR